MGIGFPPWTGGSAQYIVGYEGPLGRGKEAFVARARELFHRGLPLVEKVERRLALDLELFSRGGMEILNLIERQGYDVLSRRPELTKSGKARLILRRLSAQLAGLRPHAR